MADELADTSAIRLVPMPQALLTVAGGVSALIYVWVAALSPSFAFDSVEANRPILLVLALLTTVFAVSLGALWAGLQIPTNRSLYARMLLPGILFRLLLLPSTPIQEIDLYRYLWDGFVTEAGVNPFRYSPQQVISAGTEPDRNGDLARLAELADATASTRAVLRRVHFPELTTAYPPVSQLVFLAAARMTPARASVEVRVAILKFVLVLFDMATWLVVLALLRLAGKHPAWSILYGWSPLVLKEFANSGHLDSIAVFPCTLATYLVIRWFVVSTPVRRPVVAGAAVSTVLALAIGAKLFPIVIAPLWITTAWRRAGWKVAFSSTLVLVFSSGACLWPMLSLQSPGNPEATPNGGLQAFLSRWEMNDLLFLVVVENLRPQENVPLHQRPWFSFVPEGWKHAAVRLAVAMGVSESNASFVLARALSIVAFAALATVWAWRFGPAGVEEWLRGGFLTLAWFWLLAPTQNPWYWTWALPLLPFARSRVWWLVGPLALTYYFRFWLAYHLSDRTVLGTPYHGTWFFDFVVTWFEFGPWLLLLSINGYRLSRANGGPIEDEQTWVGCRGRLAQRKGDQDGLSHRTGEAL